MTFTVWANAVPSPSVGNELRKVQVHVPTLLKWGVVAKTKIALEKKVYQGQAWPGFGERKMSLIVLGFGLTYLEEWNV